MENELVILLGVAVVGVSAGVLVRWLFVTKKPEWYRALVKITLHRPWPVLLGGALFFAVLALASFRRGQYYFGALFSAFFLVEVASFLLCGFRRLTREDEKLIDAADPGSLWRFLWCRRKRRGEEPHVS